MKGFHPFVGIPTGLRGALYLTHSLAANRSQILKGFIKSWMLETWSKHQQTIFNRCWYFYFFKVNGLTAISKLACFDGVLCCLFCMFNFCSFKIICSSSKLLFGMGKTKSLCFWQIGSLQPTYWRVIYIPTLNNT